MSFRIVVPRVMTESELAAIHINGDRPRHGIAMLAHELDAEIHSPSLQNASGLDSLRARIAGPAALWVLAREVATVANSGDVIFCGTEAGGLQMAEVCGGSAKKMRLCMFVHNLDRPRGRLALALFGIRESVDLLLACSSSQTAFLKRSLNTDDTRVRFIWDHTDNAFFCPGPVSVGKRRPLVVSVGLEQRDYKTLAAATADMNVDVKISGFSEDAAVLSKTFPSTMPSNMSRRFYSWRDLVQLYRDADVVVVSVHENKYAAGVQSLMEGMACGRPIVATSTTGLKTYLDESSVLSVPPGDAAAMRNAIVRTLDDPVTANLRARRGLALSGERHGIERYVNEIAAHLRELQQHTGRLAP
ncbi:MAG: glycosyltransferase [Pseudomonadota bacterium]